MNEGIKHDQDKPNWSLLPLSTVEEVVKVLDHGAKKYAPYNWQRMEDRSRFLSAALRHLSAYQDDEVLDPESDLHHLAHATCNLIFLLWHEQNQPHSTSS